VNMYFYLFFHIPRNSAMTSDSALAKYLRVCMFNTDKNFNVA
jgi:hypothetical protein